MNVIHGDCLEELKKLEDNSVDAVITDPPYGLSNTKPQQVADVLKAWVTGDTVSVPAKRGGFMGADWDSFVPPPAVWAECLRVLKPGGHMAVFAGARTQDLMGLSIRLAGFEIRDTLGWIYGSGFPKSMDISKAIEKKRDDLEPVRIICRYLRAAMDMKGIKSRDLAPDFNCHSRLVDHWAARDTDSQPTLPKWEQWLRLKELLDLPDDMDAEVWRLNGRKGKPGEAWEKREVVSERPAYGIGGNGILNGHSEGATAKVTISASDAAKRWDGWGTALKPAIEPIILARKPLDGTVAANVLAHGVGGLNIDACRVQTGDTLSFGSRAIGTDSGVYGKQVPKGVGGQNPAGRFPANVLLDEHAAKEMDRQSGVSVSRANTSSDGRIQSGSVALGVGVGRRDPSNSHNDSGGASRFFPVFKYQAKAPKKERPAIVREDGTKVQHPTVKPLALMEWLVTLTAPEGGTVLDPFAGTGTTLQAAINKGFQPIGIEQDADYIQLIEKRLSSMNNTGVQECESCLL